MKLIGCSIGVLMVSGAITLAIAPLSSQAQTSSAICTLSSPPSGSSALSQCNQQNQINAQTRTQLQAVLTPEQIDRLQTAIDRNGNVQPDAFTALHLSPQQQTEVMEILQSTRQQGNNVLTPSQIEQVRQNLPFHP